MNNRYRDLALFGEGFAKAAKRSDDSIWHVFVQILLPLVLILTFVSVLDILKYKDVAEIERIHAQDLRDELEELDPTKALEKYKVTLTELQYITLIKNLEEIKHAQLNNLKLLQFPDANRIQLEGVEIEDTLFQKMCTLTHDYFDRKQIQHNKNSIYRALLVRDKELQFKDHAGLRMNVRFWNDIEISPEDSYTADLTVVTTRNRKRLHNAIVEFFDTTQKQIILLQTELLHLIINELMVKPEQIDTRSRKLVEDLIAEEDKQKRDLLAIEFYRRIIAKWNKKLDDQNYLFLRDTWNNFKYLK